MINSLLVAASLASIEEILKERGVPYELEDGEAYRGYVKVWEESDQKDAMIRKARPAIRRIASKEPYLFLDDGDPLMIRFNDNNRRMEDSFAEMLFERADKDWRIALSVKSDAEMTATMPVADRESDSDNFMKQMVVYNEIDDWGFRIFGNPCSVEYFDDMNEILARVDSADLNAWRDRLNDDSFVYDAMITPMLRAMGREMPRICKNHPEAPQQLIDYFYRKIDYYYIDPIDEVGVTRIGAVNSHKMLGRIPGNDNLYTPSVEFPTQLLDVRLPSGKYGELSRDTIQFTFDGGWAVRIHIFVEDTPEHGRLFGLKVYLPVTPFGSYRDQVEWE